MLQIRPADRSRPEQVSLESYGGGEGGELVIGAVLGDCGQGFVGDLGETWIEDVLGARGWIGGKVGPGAVTVPQGIAQAGTQNDRQAGQENPSEARIRSCLFRGFHERMLVEPYWVLHSRIGLHDD